MLSQMCMIQINNSWMQFSYVDCTKQANWLQYGHELRKNGVSHMHDTQLKLNGGCGNGTNRVSYHTGDF